MLQYARCWNMFLCVVFCFTVLTHKAICSEKVPGVNFNAQTDLSSSNPPPTDTEVEDLNLSKKTSLPPSPPQITIDANIPYEFPKTGVQKYNESILRQLEENNRKNSSSTNPSTPHEKTQETTVRTNVDVPRYLTEYMEDFENDRRFQKLIEEQAQRDRVDTEVETVEEGKITEDVLRKHHDSGISVAQLRVAAEDPSERVGVPLIQGQLAAILAGVFVLVSIVAYVALLTWRRFLERKYGNRQLVTEEDFNDDIRYFSI